MLMWCWSVIGIIDDAVGGLGLGTIDVEFAVETATLCTWCC